MKKIIGFLIFLFVPILVQSQVITEKSLVKIENVSDADAYSLKYDGKSGTYLYMIYDSTKELKYSVISNKGNSEDYDNIENYNVKFDSDGNYYAVANKKLSDTVYKYFLLKNGKEIFSSDFINSDFAEKDGILYFVCTDKEKSFLSSYDMSAGKLSGGKAYDELILCLYESAAYEGEPAGKLGFTKEGKPFYLAKQNEQAFMVIGEAEQKHYADIDTYNILKDKSDNFIFVAKDTGSLMYNGGIFVVQGDKKYNPFFSIGNLAVDNKGNVAYIAGEESENYNLQKVVLGNKVISKTYDGGAYNLGFTGNGKMFYIASEKKKNSDEYESFVVFDGKEGKRYESIISLKALPDNSLLYTIQKNADKSAIIKDGEEYKVKQASIVTAEMLADGRFAYIGVTYGNYEKNIKDKNYVYIEGEEFGPYEIMQMINYESGNYFLSDKNGNYAYLVNNTKNNTDYYSVLYTNSGKSAEFDYIQDIFLYNGKGLFSASKIYDKEKYLTKSRIYYGSKAISPEYDAINEFKLNEKTKTATFLAAKRNELFKVEIKF